MRKGQVSTRYNPQFIRYLVEHFPHAPITFGSNSSPLACLGYRGVTHAEAFPNLAQSRPAVPVTKVNAHFSCHGLSSVAYSSASTRIALKVSGIFSSGQDNGRQKSRARE